MLGDERNMPEAGKLNGGQKLLFWLLTACMLLLVLSGIVIWRATSPTCFQSPWSVWPRCCTQQPGQG